MKVVSRFEANLLSILRFFLRRAPLEQALPLVIHPCPQPPCLSRAAVELVQDTLSKGCMLLLTRAGGWRRERFLRHDRIQEGRLWERTPPEELGLTFSRHTMRFLLWITATQLPSDKPPKAMPVQELTLGDWWLYFLAYGALRPTSVGPMLRNEIPGILRNGLCRLAYPEDFAQVSREVPVDFALWTKGLGACILESLQGELKTRWLEVERGKGLIGDVRTMRSLGQAQEQTLQGFLEAAEAAGRLDLTRFLLEALSELLADQPEARAWVGQLQFSGQRLAERTEIYRSALVLLRQMERLHRWEMRARGVGYLDEGYAASQLWKADWESRQGDLLLARAQAVIRELEPLKSS